MPVTTLHPPSAQDLAQVAHRFRTEPAYGAYLLLRVGFTALPILFGADKFFNVLTNWEHYLAPWIVRLIPITSHQAMLVVGVIEIVAGLAVAIKPATRPTSSLSGWPVSLSTSSATRVLRHRAA